MTTKEHCLFFKKDKQVSVVKNNLNNQFNSFNLNQNNQCFAEIIHSKNTVNHNKEISNYERFKRTAIITPTLDYPENNDSSKTRQNFGLYRKSKLTSTLANPNIQNDYGKKEEKIINANKSSTLSLHISAYENSFKAITSDDPKDCEKDGRNKKTKIKSWKAVKKLVQGSASVNSAFELPRQQKVQNNDPEVMQFKASQQLSDVNGALLSRIAEHANILGQNIAAIDDLQLPEPPLQQLAQPQIHPGNEQHHIRPVINYGRPQYLFHLLHGTFTQIIFILYILFVIFPTLCLSSIGDKFSYFQDCTGFCRRDFECPVYNFAYSWTTSLCFQCRQKCTFETVQIFQEKGWKIPQFFGKWPFTAFYLNFGSLFFLIQEPASTIFSLFNLFGVYKMHKRICREVDDEFRMKTVWKGYGWVGIIVWICSALFHSRDFWLTEYLDYFAACSLIFYAMFAGISFVFPWLQSTNTGKKIWAAIGTSITLFFVGHVCSLLSDFDYGHNMFYCISASLITAAIYLIWFVREVMAGKGRRSLGALFMLIAVGLGSALFEVLDFPPIFWIFDAHSLFHAATIPTPFLLTEFAILEAKYEQDLTKTRLAKIV